MAKKASHEKDGKVGSKTVAIPTARVTKGKGHGQRGGK